MKRSSKQAEAAPTSEALAGQVASLSRELSAVAHELTLADPADVERGTQLQARKLALLAAREAAQGRHGAALEAERHAEQERQAEALAAQRAAALAVVDEHTQQVQQCAALLSDAISGVDAAIVGAQLRGATPSLETMAPIESLRRGLKLANEAWSYQENLPGTAERYEAAKLDDARAGVARAQALLEEARKLPDKTGLQRDKLIDARVQSLIQAERFLALRDGLSWTEPSALEIEARQKQARAGGKREYPSLDDLDAPQRERQAAFLKGR